MEQSRSVDRGNMLQFKEELKDTEVYIAPTTLHHMDSNYRINQQDAIVVKTESAIDNINVDVTLCRGEEQKSITNELIAVDGQKYAQATPASGSVNVDLDVHIKDEPEDTDLDIGPTVLQQIDPCYRINQQNTNVLKTENTIDYDDNNTILCSRVWEESVDKCAEAEPNIFICDYCQKTFSKKFVMKVHITCVHASGSYKCNQCEKSFKCERYLKIHKAYKHTSLMKECNICGKKLRPYYVKSHVLRVHSDKKVQCKICGENMTSKHSLQHHMNNIHSQQSIDSDIYDSNSQNVKSKRRKSRSTKDWHKEQEFQCHSEADSYVQSCKIWKKCTSYKAMEGLKVTYRCTGGLYRQEECPAGLRLLYHADSLKVSLFKSSCHSKHTDGTRGLKLSTREVIRKMYADGIRTPNAIIAAFRNRNMEEPKKIKLKNFLAKLRVEKFGPPTISVSKLLQ